MSRKTNWKTLLALTAAVAGVGAAAAFYVRRLLESGRDVEGMIDDVITFCTVKVGELERIIRDPDVSAAN